MKDYSETKRIVLRKRLPGSRELVDDGIECGIYKGTPVDGVVVYQKMEDFGMHNSPDSGIFGRPTIIDIVLDIRRPR